LIFCKLIHKKNNDLDYFVLKLNFHFEFHFDNQGNKI
jgi:hypothetical protein